MIDLENTLAHNEELSSNKLIKQNLLDGDVKYKELLLGLPVAVYICYKDGFIDSYNNAAVALWGCEPEVGNKIWSNSCKIFKPDGTLLPLDEFPIYISIKEAKKLSEEEFIIEQPDGTKKNICAHTELILDSKQNFIGTVNTLLDITVQRRMDLIIQRKLEKRTIALTSLLNQKTIDLIESEDCYQKMIDEVEDYAILLLDENGTIINWNKGVQKIKGYQASDIIGKNFAVFYREEDQLNGLPMKLLNEAKQNEKALHEGWRVRKDGTHFWGSITITALHNQQNEVIGYTKVTRDLTERKNVEELLRNQSEELMQKNEALKSQKEFVELILDSSGDFIAVLDKDLRYVLVNKQFHDTYKIDSIIGRKINEAFPQSVENGLYKDLLSVLDGNPIMDYSYKSNLLNKYFQSKYIPLINDQQEVYGVLAISHDSSDILAAAEEVKLANAELEIKNKELERSNDSLEQFAFLSSHDLQEPLRKIQTFSDLILTRIEDPSFKPNEYLIKISNSANRMSLLINALLNFSRLSKIDEQFEKVDLEHVLDQIFNDFELLINQKNAVITKTALPIIHAIPIQINQLFNNLISNALKFCDNEPKIDITAKIMSAKDFEKHTDLDNTRSYVHLNFKDNGIGFDQIYADQIFTIFQRLNSRQKYSGTGIGLAMCKKIVDNHNGFITAHSEKGKGASFDIYLPV